MPKKKSTKKQVEETVKVTGELVIETVKDLLHAGNIRRITIKDDKGKKVFDFPLTFGIIGAIISAPLAILATLIVLAKEYTITVVKEVEDAK